MGIARFNDSYMDDLDRSATTAGSEWDLFNLNDFCCDSVYQINFCPKRDLNLGLSRIMGIARFNYSYTDDLDRSATTAGMVEKVVARQNSFVYLFNCVSMYLVERYN